MVCGICFGYKTPGKGVIGWQNAEPTVRAASEREMEAADKLGAFVEQSI